MTEPKLQHIVPKTYLRRFQIDNDSERNKVWCVDLENKYRQKPEIKGINDKVFKIKHFYTNSLLEEKYGLEKFFAYKLEPTYNEIMAEVDTETNLSEDIRIKIFQWLFYTKIRSSDFRRQAKNVTKSLAEMLLQFDLKKNHSKLSIAHFEKDINDYSDTISKNLLFNSLYDKKNFDDLFAKYYDNLVTKDWVIYKTNLDYPFISSDNPGFSLNWTKFYNQRPFHRVIHLNHPSFNFFILSPKYCLYMQPFKEGVDVKRNALNMEIRYESISNGLVDFINFGAYYTSNKLIYSNRMEMIEKWINKN